MGSAGITHELHRSGFDVSWDRVETREAMAEALDRGPWDLILSDFGTTVDGLIGKTDADFNTNADLEVMDTGRTKAIPEEAVTDARGVRRWLQTIKRPLLGRDGRAEHVLGVATDVTERKHVEQALRKSEQRFARLLYMSGYTNGATSQYGVLGEGVVLREKRSSVAWLR